MIVGYTRVLRRSLRYPDLPESAARIAICKKKLPELIEKTDSLCF
jgi:hypothetical protein